MKGIRLKMGFFLGLVRLWNLGKRFQVKVGTGSIFL